MSTFRGWDAWRAIPWPWAIGSVAVVVLVLVTTLVAHTVVLRASEAALVIPAPSTPFLQVTALVRPDGGARLVAMDASAGVVDVLAARSSAQATTPQGCPPKAKDCVAAPPVATFLVLDDETGTVKARTSLNGACNAARNATALVSDPAHRHTYALAGTTLTTFDSVTGTCLGATILANGPASGSRGQPAFGSLVGAAFTPNGGGLYLAYSSALVLVDPASGLVERGGAFPPQTAPLIAGPVLASGDNAVFALAQDQHGRRLVAFAADTLSPMGNWPLAAGTRLGPLTPDARALVLFAKDGAVAMRSITSLLASQPSTGGAPETLAQIGGQRGVMALGWVGPPSGSGQEVLAASMSSTRLLASAGASTRTIATLPVSLAPWPGWVPLPVDASRGVSMLVTENGWLVFARNVPTHALGNDARLLLAHAALTRYLPDTNQQPPFLAPATFPLSAGTEARTYYIHFSDLGWQGPYPGTASVSVASTTDGTGATQITYGVTWDQLFPRTHQWVVRVAADGSVRLVDSSGDAIP